MELIFANLEKLKVINEDVVATIGQFDGLHLAHLSLINKTIEIAKSKNLKSCLITFDPHPDFVLKKDLSNTYITPTDKKIEFLSKMDLDYLLVIKFENEFAKLEPVEFVNQVLISNSVKEVVVGFDFKFGCFGKGAAEDISSLSNNLIKTTIMDEIKYETKKMGSTLVKELLKIGNVEEVEKILGRPYKISGVVIKGNQVGRTINFPTANLMVDSSFAKILPGVYAVRVKVDDNYYKGIANLGNNPSFNKLDHMSFETHIVDFNHDIYGKHIEIELISYLRDEKKFNGVEDFLNQIKDDLDKMNKIFTKLKNK